VRHPGHGRVRPGHDRLCDRVPVLPGPAARRERRVRGAGLTPASGTARGTAGSGSPAWSRTRNCSARSTRRAARS
jgi:hypothetical protein